MGPRKRRGQSEAGRKHAVLGGSMPLTRGSQTEGLHWGSLGCLSQVRELGWALGLVLMLALIRYPEGTEPGVPVSWTEWLPALRGEQPAQAEPLLRPH